MSLPLRELGKTGVKIPVIGLGCMVCSTVHYAVTCYSCDLIKISIERA